MMSAIVLAVLALFFLCYQLAFVIFLDLLEISDHVLKYTVTESREKMPSVQVCVQASQYA